METRTQAYEIDVLIVEPSHVQAAVLHRELQNLGVVNIDEVDTAEAALEHMRNRSTSVVISSFYLPDMSGADLVQKMRADDEMKQVQFVLISSEHRDFCLETVRQSGVSAILDKPLDTEKLSHALNITMEMMCEDDSDDGDFAEHQLRVLLVDDMVSARRYMRRTLEHLGITDIVEAENGREAVEQLNDVAFDLIVTDYNMPEMDGKQLVESVRNDSWQQSVPIIMVTSEHNERRLAAVHEAGVSHICDKPFDPFTVQDLLHKVLELEVA